MGLAEQKGGLSESYSSLILETVGANDLHQAKATVY